MGVVLVLDLAGGAARRGGRERREGDTGRGNASTRVPPLGRVSGASRTPKLTRVWSRSVTSSKWLAVCAPSGALKTLHRASMVLCRPRSPDGSRVVSQGVREASAIVSINTQKRCARRIRHLRAQPVVPGLGRFGHGTDWRRADGPPNRAEKPRARFTPAYV